MKNDKTMTTHFNFTEDNLSKFLLTRFKETGDYYFLFQLLLSYEKTQDIWNYIKKENNINENDLEKTRTDFMYKSLDELIFGMLDFILSDDGIHLIREMSKHEKENRIPFFNGYYNFMNKYSGRGKHSYSKYIEKYILKRLEERK